MSLYRGGDTIEDEDDQELYDDISNVKSEPVPQLPPPPVSSLPPPLPVSNPPHCQFIYCLFICLRLCLLFL